MLITRAQLYAAMIACGILLVATIGLSLHLWGFRIGPLGFDGVKDKLEDCSRDRNELRGLIDEADRRSKQLQAELDKRIPQIIERVRDNPVARRVENAPLPEGCRTPVEILEEPML